MSMNGDFFLAHRLEYKIKHVTFSVSFQDKAARAKKEFGPWP
jgi:hypothetical protein